MTAVCVEAYILQGWIDLIIDLDLTPQIMISPMLSTREMNIPLDYLVDDCMTINVSAGATQYVELDKNNGYINVGARFNKVHHDLLIPLECVVGTSSKCGKIALAFVRNAELRWYDENGKAEGPTTFAPPVIVEALKTPDTPVEAPPKRERPDWLKVVK